MTHSEHGEWFMCLLNKNQSSYLCVLHHKQKNVNFSKFEHRRLDCYNDEIIFEPFRKTLSMPFVGEDYWLESIIILRFLFSWNYG